MAELRDPKNRAHVNRVAGYAVEIYEYGKPPRVSKVEIAKNKDILRIAAMAPRCWQGGHLGLDPQNRPASILPEYEIMRPHLSCQTLCRIHSILDQASAEVALSHHERWDGNGYPGYINVMTASACRVMKPAKAKPGP